MTPGESIANGDAAQITQGIRMRRPSGTIATRLALSGVVSGMDPVRRARQCSLVALSGSENVLLALALTWMGAILLASLWWRR